MRYVIPKKGIWTPRWFYDKLLKYEEFIHLRDGDARVEFLLVGDEIIRSGRQVLGEVHIPTVQGKLRGVFEWMLEQQFDSVPDFLVMLDQSYWDESGRNDREILIFHEMCHMIHKTDADGELRYDEDGNPVWGIVGHDVEEFVATVARYGAYSDELRRFLEAANGAR